MINPLTSDVALETVASAPLVRTCDVVKAFGATQAIRSASIELHRGEVLAIIGENGSGKSTLVKILSGVHAPDSGTFALPGGRTGPPRSPADAIAAGIVTVFQEVLVSPPRSVYDNVWVGAVGPRHSGERPAEKRERARALLEELLGRVPALELPVEQLSLSDRQACAIVRGLVRQPDVLILDEATSALDVATRERLFAIIQRVAGEGTGVIFISHRMDEIEEIGDRITVMRSGTTVATVDRGKASMAELVRLMTGEDQVTGGVTRRQRRSDAVGAPLIAARGVRLRPGAPSFDLDVRQGELVGVAGLDGHGQDRFLHVLRGVEAHEGAVTITNGSERAITSPRKAFASGIAYVPRERRAEGLFHAISIRGNFSLPTVGRDARFGLINRRRSERRFAEWAERLRLRYGKSRDDVDTLSGGNQQKVLLARWLAAHPRVLVLNDPTRGVDIGVKREIYALLTQLADDGVAVVMLSTELDEHVELMDRVIVFREDRPVAELEGPEITREALVYAFFGRAPATGAET